MKRVELVYKRLKMFKLFFTSVLILVISAFFVLVDNSQNEINFVQAGTGDNVAGFAWSYNVGWISFNSTDCDTDEDGTYEGASENGGAAPSGCPSSGTVDDYGVKIDSATGNFSGYAWSSNVGWISFDRSDTGNPPSDDPGSGAGPIAKVDFVSAVPGEINGWAKILSLGDDGWIRFSYSEEGSPLPFPIPFPFSEINVGGLEYDAGVDMVTGNLFGWAWNGNDDGTGIGWISLSGSSPVYGVHASINRAPEKATLAGATLIAKCSNVLGMQLSWDFDDPDIGDYQSAYRVQIRLLNTGIWGSILDSDWQTPPLPSPESFNFSEALGHNINYNTDYEYRVNVRDNFGAESDWSDPMNFSTPDYKYPEVRFNWTPSTPSAGQEILFSTVGAVKSNYYTSGNVQYDCDDSNCGYQWTFSYVDSDGNTQIVSGSNDTASSTTIIFPQRANISAALDVQDKNTIVPAPDQYECSSSTAIGLKNKLPTWIETK